MPSPVFALPAQYVRQIADQILRMGVALPDSFLRHKWHEIEPADTSYTMAVADFQQLLQDALDATGEPAFGLLVGERLMVNSHGILGYAAMNSSTLGQAMDLLQDYIQIRTRLVAIRQDCVGDELRFSFEEGIALGAVQQPVLEAVVLAIKKLFDFIAGGVSPVGLVAFPFAPPGYAALATEMFGCEVRYGSDWAGLTFARAIVDAPLAMANPTTLRETLLICQKQLEQLAQQPSWRVRIRRMLLEERNGYPPLNVAARLFNLTPRTLHRRLLEEGTSYSAVLDEVRHRLALEHLKAGKLSLQEIAYVLGYTDQSNFRRAFKRWEGVAPSTCQLRYQQAGGFTASLALAE